MTGLRRKYFQITGYIYRHLPAGSGTIVVPVRYPMICIFIVAGCRCLNCIVYLIDFGKRSIETFTNFFKEQLIQRSTVISEPFEAQNSNLDPDSHR
jgi:hypothetical protein